jgi:hypothetical protein
MSSRVALEVEVIFLFRFKSGLADLPATFNLSLMGDDFEGAFLSGFSSMI